MKPLKRYDYHRSHVSTIPRMKRMIQLVDVADDFENWRKDNLPINWHGERCRRKAMKGGKR